MNIKADCSEVEVECKLGAAALNQNWVGEVEGSY